MRSVRFDAYYESRGVRFLFSEDRASSFLCKKTMQNTEKTKTKTKKNYKANANTPNQKKKWKTNSLRAKDKTNGETKKIKQNKKTCSCRSWSKSRNPM